MKKKSSHRQSNQDLFLRVHISEDGAAEIEVNPEKWKDPEVWGILLSDIANTIAEAYATESERAMFRTAMEKAFVREGRASDQSGKASRPSG